MFRFVSGLADLFLGLAFDLVFLAFRAFFGVVGDSAVGFFGFSFGLVGYAFGLLLFRVFHGDIMSGLRYGCRCEGHRGEGSAALRRR